MFKQKLYYILKDLDNMVSHNNAMERCILKKLNNSLNTYTKEVETTCNYLLSRSSYKVIKNIAKQEGENSNGKYN